MTTQNICTIIRAHGGEVHVCGQSNVGYIIRVDVYGRPCRLIFPSISGKTLPNVAPEPGWLTHVIVDAEHLQEWLSSLAPSFQVI